MLITWFMGFRIINIILSELPFSVIELSSNQTWLDMINRIHIQLNICFLFLIISFIIKMVFRILLKSNLCGLLFDMYIKTYLIINRFSTYASWYQLLYSTYISEEMSSSNTMVEINIINDVCNRNITMNNYLLIN